MSEDDWQQYGGLVWLEEWHPDWPDDVPEDPSWPEVRCAVGRKP